MNPVPVVGIYIGWKGKSLMGPDMFTWLSSRYLEHRSVNGIVEGFERFLASRGLTPIPDPPSPPAIVFVTAPLAALRVARRWVSGS